MGLSRDIHGRSPSPLDLVEVSIQADKGQAVSPGGHVLIRVVEVKAEFVAGGDNIPHILRQEAENRDSSPHEEIVHERGEGVRHFTLRKEDPQ